VQEDADKEDLHSKKDYINGEGEPIEAEEKEDA
jgi:hypothetical protein